MRAPRSATSQADNIAFFFTEPDADWLRWRDGEARRSVLALVRQEIMDCLVGEWRPEAEVAHTPADFQRLFAAAMVILAGVDLLGKFLAGDDAKAKVGPRFLSFAKRFMDLANGEADALYTVRNSLMHSFGLFDRKNQRGIVFQQECDGNTTSPVFEVEGIWSVCLHHLYLSFIEAVGRYEAAVQQDAGLQSNFQKVYPDYGYVVVGQEMFRR